MLISFLDICKYNSIFNEEYIIFYLSINAKNSVFHYFHSWHNDKLFCRKHDLISGKKIIVFWLYALRASKISYAQIVFDYAFDYADKNMFESNVKSNQTYVSTRAFVANEKIDKNFVFIVKWLFKKKKW